jgi:hypothetical protein
MDVAGINPGMDFRKAIDDNVASCGVLLAVIGPTWATMADSTGTRRLEDPNDFVRLEIASALARDVAVIPVLVHDAKMPHPDQLPDNLKDLAYRNSVEISHARWNSDVQLLTAALGSYVAPAAATDTKPVHATVSVQLPPPTAPVATPEPNRRSNLPLVLGIVVAAVIALGVVGYMFLHPHGTAAPTPPGPSPVNPNPPAPAGLSAFLGTWINPSPKGKGEISRLAVKADGDQISIQAWGKCDTGDCDWGTQQASPGATQQAEVTFNMSQDAKDRTRSAAITIQPLNGQLSVSITNTYSDRGPTHRLLTFVKAQ